MSRKTPKLYLDMALPILSAHPGYGSQESLLVKKPSSAQGNESLDAYPLVSPISLSTRDTSSSEDSAYDSIYHVEINSGLFDLALTENDRVIVLMGRTGTGKSTFINCAVGREVAQVTHSVTSCTREIQLFQCRHPYNLKQRVFLVDTPGFDNTKTKTQTETLQQISDWFISTYRQDIKLTGILQFESITDAPMTATRRASLRAFSELCGSEALSSVVVVSTCWEDLDDPAAGGRREHDLRRMMTVDYGLHGVKYSRFAERTKEAAWDVIDLLQGQGRVLQIQREVVDQRKPLGETSAFQSIRKTWHRWKTSRSE